MISAWLMPQAPLSPDVLSIPARVVEPTETEPFSFRDITLDDVFAAVEFTFALHPKTWKDMLASS